MTLAYIPVTETEFAIVDLDCVPQLFDVNVKWCLSGKKYAHARRSCYGNVLMHRLICNEALVDHINGDTLDNRRANLRYSDKQRNSLNRPLDKNNATGFKGVSQIKKSGKYRASLFVGKAVHIGTYATAKEAALAYDKAMYEWAGTYGTYNFPEELI